MSHRAKRGPQALTADRRQARPTAHYGLVAPPARAAAVHTDRGDATRRRAGATRAHPQRVSLLAETEPGVDRCLRAVADLSRFGREPTRAGLVWSDEQRTAEAIARLRRHELAPRLRSLVQLESDEDAEALLTLDLEWLRYSRPEETADVAALLPSNLHELRAHTALLTTPRWRRLRVAPPRLAP